MIKICEKCWNVSDNGKGIPLIYCRKQKCVATRVGKSSEGRKFIRIQAPLPRGNMECKHNINSADEEGKGGKGGNRGLECLAGWSQPLSHP